MQKSQKWTLLKKDMKRSKTSYIMIAPYFYVIFLLHGASRIGFHHIEFYEL